MNLGPGLQTALVIALLLAGLVIIYMTILIGELKYQLRLANSVKSMLIDKLKERGKK